MGNAVLMKGTTYGFQITMEEGADFSEICDEIVEKFRASAKFFGNAKMALSFEGKQLSMDETRELLDLISQNSNCEIACIIEHNSETEELHRLALETHYEEAYEEMAASDLSTGQFYKGNLRSGQSLDLETSIIIIGDVNQGASVTSKGNIIVLGSLFGTVHAGAGGNGNAFVVALEMDPVQIRIDETIARAPDKTGKKLWKREKENTEPKIAFRNGDGIFIEPLSSKAVLNDIQI